MGALALCPFGPLAFGLELCGPSALQPFGRLPCGSFALWLLALWAFALLVLLALWLFGLWPFGPLALLGKRERDVSAMLKGVVANMHVLCRFSREAGFLPYIGHAHYIYECYLKSRINSSSPQTGCDLSIVWSLMVDLDKDLPRACSLTLKPSL